MNAGLRPSLNVRLVLAFLLVSLLGTVLVGVIMGRWIADRFPSFLFTRDRDAILEKLADYYRTHGSWEGVREAVLGASSPDSQALNPAFPVALADAAGRVVAPGVGYEQGQWVPPFRLAAGVHIRVDGQVSGTLLIDRRAFELSVIAQRFLTAAYQALVRTGLIATVVAVVLGVLLAHSLTRPLRELTEATRAVARGELEQQVPVRTDDELGQLASSFNQMSAELIRARDSRRQMTADIAHDLRTPLSIILGHAEALAEGVLPPEPETLSLIHDEAKRLSGLVEDLRTLSLAEAGELPIAPQPILPLALLERVAAAHRPRAEAKAISLTLQDGSDGRSIEADADRMAQVLDNLLDNALRHTPEGGAIRLSVAAANPPQGEQRADAPRCRLVVQDSGPGVAPEEVERIFERFHRGDKARRREEGGSGLGLAIARSIVEQHGGRIWAESPPGEGLRVIVELPESAC